MILRAALLIAALAIVSIAVVLVVSLAPGFVTYVPKAPPNISCGYCNDPSVQAALGQSVSFGQSQIQALIQSSAWVVISAAVVNILCIVAMLWQLRSNFSSKPTADAAA